MSANGKRVFQTFNPVLNSENPTLFVEASEEEINRSVDLADSAFNELSSISFLKKADFLDEIANQIELLGDELLHCFVSESGLTIDRARVERTRTVNQLRSFAQLVRENNWVEASIDTADNNRVPPKPDLRKMLVGIGPVVVFGASNFPLAYSTAGGDTASAFAAGCPVIVKSHPLHAGTGEMVAGAIVSAVQKIGMPKGIFSNLNAIGYEVGKQLVLHPKIKAVGFTGSISGGRALFDLANSRPEPIPVFAEMGSVNPVIILPEILKENSNHWSSIYADSITSGNGQFCTNPGLLFLIKSRESELFLNELKDKILLKAPSAMLHSSILENFERNKKKALTVSHLELIEKPGKIPPNYSRQTILTVKGAVFIENSVLHEEVFGPFTLVVICEDLNELEIAISELKGQLTGSIISFVENINQYRSLISTLQRKVGRLIFNGVPTGVEVCPSMHHGGPYPASTDSRFTAVGIDSIRRFARPVVYQNFPEGLLPEVLKNENSSNSFRRIEGELTKNHVFGKKM